MSEPVGPIGNVSAANNYHAPLNKSTAPTAISGAKDTAQTSSQYIIEGNSVFYERYDRHGKLISRVPWTVHPIDEKA